MQSAHRSAQLLRDDAQEVCRQRCELEAALEGRAAAGQGMIRAACCGGALRQACKQAPNRVKAALGKGSAWRGRCPQDEICNGTACGLLWVINCASSGEAPSRCCGGLTITSGV